MEIKINYLDIDKSKKIWETRQTGYISDSINDDIKVSTISHEVNSIVVNHVTLKCKKDVTNLIEFLKNVKPSFLD